MKNTKNIKKVVIASVSAVLILFLFVIVLKAIERRNIDINIEVCNYRNNVFESSNGYYILQHDGVYLYDSDKAQLLVENDSISQFVCNDEYICVLSQNDSLVITAYKSSGEKIAECEFEDIYLLAIDQSYLYASQCSSNYDKELVLFDISNGFKKIDINAQKLGRGTNLSFIRGNDTTIFISDNRCIASFNGLSVRCSYRGTSQRILEYSSDILVYTDNLNVDSIDIYNTSLNTIHNVELRDTDLCGTSVTFSYLEDSKFVLASNGAQPVLGMGGDFNTSTQLKYHTKDSLVTIETISGEIVDSYKTRKYERILYADSEKAITYYDGEYLTYSLEDWKVIDKQDADEIKDGGSYFFEACGEYIFVFDNKTDKLINKIKV